ncbi:MAG TPA: hypothetical protein V6D14_04180 [Coleofasciculaceae cyanobacterium]|jgi:hypothetical protein
MTNETNQPQDYCYIKVPKTKFPQPKFYPTQQVGIPWHDDEGNSFYDIGVIIGMIYGESDDQSGQWYYFFRYLKCDYDPSLVGSKDWHFIEESGLVADTTVLGD